MVNGLVSMLDSAFRNFHLIFLIIAVFFVPFAVGFKRPKPKKKVESKKERDVEYVNEFLKSYSFAYDPD